MVIGLTNDSCFSTLKGVSDCETDSIVDKNKMKYNRKTSLNAYIDRVAIWPSKRPNQPNLAYFETVFLNEMICPFFWPFFDLDKNSIFLSLFWLNFIKTC